MAANGRADRQVVVRAVAILLFPGGNVMRTVDTPKWVILSLLLASLAPQFASAQDKIAGNEVRRYLDNAKKEADKGEFAKGAGLYLKVIESFPDNYEALFGIAPLYAQLGDPANAAASYEKALAGLEDDAQIAQAYAGMTSAYARAANYSKAVEVGRKAVELNPTDAEVAIALAMGLAKTGQIEEAADIAEKALELAPDNAFAHNTLAEAALANGDLDTAAGAFTEALELESNNAEAHAGMAAVFFARGDYDSAVESATNALDLNDQLTSAYGIRGKANNALGNSSEAQADLSMAITVNPEDPDANLAYAQVHESQGNYGQAAGYYAKAIRFNPSLYAAYAPLGDIYLDQQRYSELEQAMREVLAADPDNAYGHLYLGFAQDATERTAEALAEFIKAAELDENLAGAYYGRGKILRAQNDNTGALGFLEKAIELDGENGDYLTEYGIALFNMERADESLVALEKAAATPDYYNILGWFALGNVYLSAQRYADASGVLDKAVEASPNWGQAHRMAGWADYGQLQTGCPCTPEDEALAQKVVEHHAKMVELGAADPDLQARAEALANGGKVQ